MLQNMCLRVYQTVVGTIQCLCICCCFSDVALALLEAEIQSTLEDEMYEQQAIASVPLLCFVPTHHSTEILTNPSVQLDSIDQSKEAKKASIPLDAEERFRFALFGVPVGVVSCSARGKGEEHVCQAELSAVEKWLSSIAQAIQLFFSICIIINFHCQLINGCG